MTEPVAHERADGPADALELHQAIERALAVLTPPEEKAIRERFGLRTNFALEDVRASADVGFALVKLRTCAAVFLLPWLL